MLKLILRKSSPIVSLISLAIIILFALLCFMGSQSFDTYILWTNIASLIWFCFSPWWLISKKESSTF